MNVTILLPCSLWQPMEGTLPVVGVPVEHQIAVGLFHICNVSVTHCVHLSLSNPSAGLGQLELTTELPRRAGHISDSVVHI